MELYDPLLPLWAMETLSSLFLWTWLFCVGATVGSFLNVVVYRLPLGKNLAFPGSFCPRCGHPIRGSDNVPILSWLLLRGQCRDCQGKISSRYFFVELTVATVFLLVLAADIYLPPGSLGFATRHLLTPHDGPAFWCMYFIHVTLITTFLGFILIVADGNNTGSRLFLPVALVAFVLPLIWPQIRSVPAAIYPDVNSWWAGLIDGLAGLTAGLVFWQASDAARPRGRNHWLSLVQIGWAVTLGLTLGWQRSLYALPITAVLLVLAVRALRSLYAFNRESQSPSTPAQEISPVSPTQELDSP